MSGWDDASLGYSAATPVPDFELPWMRPLGVHAWAAMPDQPSPHSRKARQEIQNPATLEHLIVDLIDDRWSDENPDGRWRSFDYEELTKRDKLNLDIFWLKDASLEDGENLPEPEVLAAEIVEDLRALEAFEAIQAELEAG